MRLGSLSAVLLLAVPLKVAAQTPEPRTLERDILKQLIKTTPSAPPRHPDVRPHARAARLPAAGIPAADIQIVESTPGIFNLVARYRGKSGSATKPLLLMAHMDV